MESPWTRDPPRVPCTGRQTLIHCTTREVFPSLSWPLATAHPFTVSIGLGFLGLHHKACRIAVPHQGSNPCPLQWKCGVLTTRLPGKFLHSLSFAGYAIVEIIQYLVFSDWLVSLVCLSAKSFQSYLIPCNPMD